MLNKEIVLWYFKFNLETIAHSTKMYKILTLETNKMQNILFNW